MFADSLRADLASCGGRLPGDRRRQHRREVDAGERRIEISAKLMAEIEEQMEENAASTH